MYSPIIIELVTIFNEEGEQLIITPLRSKKESESIFDSYEDNKIEISLRGYFDLIDIQKWDNDLLDRINKNSLSCVLSYFFGDSGQLYELDADYEQQNSPKVMFEIVEIDVNNNNEVNW